MPNDDPESDLEKTLFGGAHAALPQVPAEGLKRYLQLGVRGATLGLGGTQAPPETFGESVAEFVGGIPTIAGVSAALSPVVGMGAKVAPMLRVPLVQRLIGAAGTGLTVEGTRAAISGEDVPTAALRGAAEYGAMESAWLGGSKLLGKALKAPPVNKTLIQSPLVNPLKEEMAKGQGLAPETPASLNLPAVRETGIFEAKDYIGSGNVLNPSRNPQTRQGILMRPEEVTRRMLPEGGVTKALPPHVEAPLPETGEVPYFETQYHAGFTELKPAEVGYFEVAHDPRVGTTVLIPKTPEVEQAAKIAMGMDPRKVGELPLSEGQIRSLERPERPGLPSRKVLLDTVSKREASLTDNLLKQPEEVVETATQRGTAPPIELHSLELTPAGMEARELLVRSGLNEDEFIKFGSTLRGTREQKLTALSDWLRTKCK